MLTLALRDNAKCFLGIALYCFIRWSVRCDYKKGIQEKHKKTKCIKLTGSRD